MVKIRVKFGAVEVEYEGPEDFLKSDLQELVNTASMLAKSGMSVSPESLVIQDQSTTGQLQGTTANIAARLGVKSGPELLMAAAGHLALVKNQKKFSRKAILDEMKTASAYYKQTYSNNLSTYLTSLIKDKKLNEPATGEFALHATAEAELKSKLK